MARKRAAVPKPKPELFFEAIPLEIVKAIAKPAENKPKMRLVIRRSKVAGR